MPARRRLSRSNSPDEPPDDLDALPNSLLEDGSENEWAPDEVWDNYEVLTCVISVGG